MKSKLIVSVLGALLLGSSAVAMADSRGGHGVRGFDHHPRHERGWSGHDRRDWGRSHYYRHYRGHPGWHGHYRPYYRHHGYQHGYHGQWYPYGYQRDGVTIILRGHIR